MGTLTEDVFINRKEAEALFKELLESKPAYRVLNFYGKNGMGKSYFQDYLQAKYLYNKDYIVINLNLHNPIFHNPKTALFEIVKKLEIKYDFNFLALWKAYALLWQKRFKKNPLIFTQDLPYVEEIKKLMKVDKKGNVIVDFIKGLFQNNVVKAFERLKNLNTKEIEKELFYFFAADLRKLKEEKKQKDIVFIIDGHETLSKDTTPCMRDFWLQELVVQFGKEALFLIISQEKLLWEKCNIVWKSQIKSYEFTHFTKEESYRYLQESGFDNAQLIEAICVSTRGHPFYLSLAKYAYIYQTFDKLPITKEDISKSFLATLNKDEQKLLEILSHTRYFTKEIIQAVAKKYTIKIGPELLHKLLSYDFIKVVAKGKFILDEELKKIFLQKENEEKKREYQSFMFSYYENSLFMLNQKKVKENPLIIDEILEEAWYYLNIISKEPLVHFEWLDYYVSRFFNLAAWEPFIERYNKIIPKLQKSTETYAKSKLVSLYNNLAGLYETMGEVTIAKNYYNKVVKLSRPKQLLA